MKTIYWKPHIIYEKPFGLWSWRCCENNINRYPLWSFYHKNENEKQKYGIHLFIFLRFRMNTKTYVQWVNFLAFHSIHHSFHLFVPRRYGIEIRNDVLFFERTFFIYVFCIFLLSKASFVFLLYSTLLIRWGYFPI